MTIIIIILFIIMAILFITSIIVVIYLRIKYRRVKWIKNEIDNIIIMMNKFFKYYYEKTGINIHYFDFNFVNKFMIYNHRKILNNWKGYDIEKYIKYTSLFKEAIKAKKNNLI